MGSMITCTILLLACSGQKLDGTYSRRTENKIVSYTASFTFFPNGKVIQSLSLGESKAGLEGEGAYTINGREVSVRGSSSAGDNSIQDEFKFMIRGDGKLEMKEPVNRAGEVYAKQR